MDKQELIRMYLGKKIKGSIDFDPYIHTKDLVGRVLKVDDMGQLHGTWGGVALVPGVDDIVILDDEGDENNESIR